MPRQAKVADRLAGDLLGHPLRVDVRGIDEIDARLHRLAQKPIGLALLQLADRLPDAGCRRRRSSCPGRVRTRTGRCGPSWLYFKLIASPLTPARRTQVGCPALRWTTPRHPGRRLGALRRIERRLTCVKVELLRYGPTLSRRGVRFTLTGTPALRALSVVTHAGAATEIRRGRFMAKSAADKTPAKEPRRPPRRAARKWRPPRMAPPPTRLQKPLKPSGELAAIVGARPAAPWRGGEQGLGVHQEARPAEPGKQTGNTCRRRISRRCSARDKVTMFEMNKYLAQHLSAEKPGAFPPRSC